MNTIPVTKRGQTMSYSVHEGVLELALNRAPCNEIGSLSLEDLESFSAALQELEPQLHAVIIHSERKAGFCAGADLRELYDRSQAMEKKAAIRGVRDFLERIHRVLNTIDASALTTIAAVQGVTFGGGLELALACDLIIAADTAVFALPEPRVGLAALAGGLLRLPRQIGYKQAMGMILTGRRVTAAEGRELGFVNEVVSSDALMATAKRWAAQIIECSPMSIRASKQIVRQGLEENTLEDAYRAQTHYSATRALFRSADLREGPLAFAQKRAPHWKAE